MIQESTEGKFAKEMVAELRSRRRWGIFFKFVLISYVTFGAVFFFKSDETISDDDLTGLVRLDGVIGGSVGTSYSDVLRGLKSAFSNRNTKGVILAINSPGGSPVQSATLNQEILRLRKEYDKKPLIVVIEDIGASGGYYVASAAEEIFASKSSLVGSIGVRLDSFGFVEGLNRLGIERRLITAGSNKGLLDPFTPLKTADLEHTQRLLDDIHKDFISAVKNGRGEKLSDSAEIYSGLIWTGRESLGLGLIDGFGSIESVAREKFSTDNVVDFTYSEFDFYSAIRTTALAIHSLFKLYPSM